MKQRFFPGWWQVIAALLLQGTVAATVSSAFSVVAVPFGEAFDASRMTVMLAMTVVALGTGALSPILGSVMDRFSLRALMLLGAIALVGGFVAISFTTSINQVLSIYGLLLAPANVLLGPLAASVLVSRWFVRKRGAALGIAAIGISVGGFIFPPLIQWLIDTFEWRGAFRWLAGISFVLTVPAILLVVVNRPTDRGLYPDGDTRPTAAGSGGPADALLTTRAILRDPAFWLIALSLGVIFFGAKGLLTNMVPLAVDAGIRADMAALLLSVYAAASFTGKLVFAGLADRFDPRVVLAVGLVGFTACMACFWQAEDVYLMMAGGCVLLGLANGGMLPLQAMLLARAFGPANLGRTTGMVTFATLPLNLMAPPLFGLIHDRTGDYDLALIIFMAFALAALLVVPRIRTRLRAEAGNSAGAHGEAPPA